jgi:hypothetical protein
MTKDKTFNIGWCNEEISVELRNRIDAAQKFLMSEPTKTSAQKKKTTSWKPIVRGNK